MNNENAFARSALPQLARSPPSKKLSEVSASANNARPTMLPPPPGTLKRKTLAERAGEPSRPAPMPPGSRPLNSTLKPTSIAGAARQNSYSSSTMTRPASSTSYRNASNSSFASSTSSRVPSSQSFRSSTSMSNHQKAKSIHVSRPATAFEQTTARDGQETPSNSTVINFSSARQFSANTSRRKKPVLDMNFQDHSDNTTERSVSSGSGKTSQMIPVRSLRDMSLSTAMTNLSINTQGPLSLPPPGNGKENVPPSPQTPSQIPKKKPSVPVLQPTPSPAKSLRKSPKKPIYLTRDSNLVASDWDLGSRVENMESMYVEMKNTMASTVSESNGLKENIAIYKARISELEDMKRDANRDNKDLREELEKMSKQLSEWELSTKRITRDHEHELSDVNKKLDELRRTHNIEVEELESKLRRNVSNAIQDAEVEKRRVERSHLDELEDLKRKLESTIEEERELRRKEVSALSSEGSLAQQKVEGQLEARAKELQLQREELDRAKEETLREKGIASKFKAQLDDANSTIVSSESTMRSLRAHVEFLESDNKSQSQSFADLEHRTQEAIREADEARAKLRTEETLRRKLHNQVQELKGNIRVFCRVRPTLPGEESETARISFPDSSADSKELEVMGQEEKSSLGTITTKKNAFAFDRVFAPTSRNAEVFDEISQLVQSALDGYNVCIFCYGQTGSGKTHTMSSEDGMIPLAVNQIYETAQSLEEKGWEYGMEGSFVEVYNESINDLLGKAEDFDKKKHDIRHDMQRCKTTVTDITTVDLDSPGKVETALYKAMNNRSIAATKANERSSRSHTVFILKLTGENSITGERSEGTLNLVDLAGSERLSHTGATGERLKETQNINKSLSCLGDVIGALGQGKDGGHIPYRNSKLTYLLQFSLGGNSKTLMFVMVSPLQAHLSETVTSLKFATKVHNTHIGTAKRQAKVRE